MKNPDNIKALKLKIKNLEAENVRLKNKLTQKNTPKKTVKTPKNVKAIFDIAENKVGNYFKNLKLNPSKGSIKINNERYVLVRASALSHEFLSSIVSLYKDKGETEALNIGKDILFDIGHVIGIEDAKLLHKKMKLKNPIEKLSAGPIHFAYSGWASVEILPESNPEPNENFFLKFNHPYSFEADAWIKNGIKSKTPVCTMNAAYSSGWCQESFGMPLTAVEITCRAKGDEKCTFIMAQPSKIDSFLNKVLKVSNIKKKPQIPYFFERKEIEERIQKNEQLLSSAQKISKLGSWEFDLKTQNLIWSNELYNIFEIDSTVIDSKILYQEYITRFHKDDLSELFKCIELATNEGKQYSITHRIIIPNGKTKWILGSGVPLTDNKNKVIKLIGYAQDITERVNTEIELNQFFKLSLDLLCLADLNGNFLKMSQGWKKVLGYENEKLISTPYMSLVHPEDVQNTLKVLTKLKDGDFVIDFENRYRHADGSYRVLNWNASPDRKTGLIYCIVRDVTLQREAEHKLKATLHEKETLLREIHHRVKNNLQIVSSLLKLHSDSVNSKEFSELVIDSQTRIVSMALIHEMLYANTDLSKINLSQYTYSLFEKLQATYNNEGIKLSLNASNKIQIEIDKMIPIGLILNETMSNSFKYAFKKNNGEISIDVSKHEIIIADNGCGAPSDFDFANHSSFGIQLIHLLSEQIDSIISFTSSSKGTVIKLSFKNPLFK